MKKLVLSFIIAAVSVYAQNAAVVRPGGEVELRTLDANDAAQAVIDATNAAAAASNEAARAAVFQSLKGSRTNYVAIIDGLQTNVDQTVFTGSQRTEFNDLRKLVLDLAREANRNRRDAVKIERFDAEE